MVELHIPPLTPNLTFFYTLITPNLTFPQGGRDVYIIDILNITKYIQFLKVINRNPLSSLLPPWGKVGLGVLGCKKGSWDRGYWA
jgi:hypothetical protein